MKNDAFQEIKELSKEEKRTIAEFINGPEMAGDLNQADNFMILGVKDGKVFAFAMGSTSNMEQMIDAAIQNYQEVRVKEAMNGDCDCPDCTSLRVLGNVMQAVESEAKGPLH